MWQGRNDGANSEWVKPVSIWRKLRGLLYWHSCTSVGVLDMVRHFEWKRGRSVQWHGMAFHIPATQRASGALPQKPLNRLMSTIQIPGEVFATDPVITDTKLGSDHLHPRYGHMHAWSSALISSLPRRTFDSRNIWVGVGLRSCRPAPK